MRKVFAIFFLLTFLNANTVFGEVLKLPILIHHFVEHSKETEDVSLLNFLAIHYKGDVKHQHQNNHNDHNKLPFKTIESHFSSVVSIVPPAFIEISTYSKFITGLKIAAHKQQNYASTYLNSIWQPPRFS